MHKTVPWIFTNISHQTLTKPKNNLILQIKNEIYDRVFYAKELKIQIFTMKIFWEFLKYYQQCYMMM